MNKNTLFAGAVALFVTGVVLMIVGTDPSPYMAIGLGLAWMGKATGDK